MTLAIMQPYLFPYIGYWQLIIEDILNNEEKNLAQFIGYSLQKISNYLEIDTKFLYSSEVKKDSTLKAQDKVIDICKNLNANKYINAIGGRELYSKEVFQKKCYRVEFYQN